MKITAFQRVIPWWWVCYPHFGVNWWLDLQERSWREIICRHDTILVKILIFINSTAEISKHRMIVILVLIRYSTFLQFSQLYTTTTATTTTKIIAIIILSTTGTVIRRPEAKLDTQQKYNSSSHHRVHKWPGTLSAFYFMDSENISIGIKR